MPGQRITRKRSDGKMREYNAEQKDRTRVTEREVIARDTRRLRISMAKDKIIYHMGRQYYIDLVTAEERKRRERWNYGCWVKG